MRGAKKPVFSRVSKKFCCCSPPFLLLFTPLFSLWLWKKEVCKMLHLVGLLFLKGLNVGCALPPQLVNGYPPFVLINAIITILFSVPLLYYLCTTFVSAVGVGVSLCEYVRTYSLLDKTMPLRKRAGYGLPLPAPSIIPQRAYSS